MAATIELYLVRHAIAAERGPKHPDDRLRPLTPAGTRKFAESVPGLIAMDVVVDFVLTQPAGARARDRASAGCRAEAEAGDRRSRSAGPGGRPQAIAEAIKTHAKRYRRLALVGHEPDLGELAAQLLGARGNIEFKKGGVVPDRRRRRHSQRARHAALDADAQSPQVRLAPLMKALVVINPIAGPGRRRSIGACADLARRSLSAHQYETDVRITAGPHDAAEFTPRCSRSPFRSRRCLGRRRDGQQRARRSWPVPTSRWRSFPADRAMASLATCRFR